MKKFVFLYNSEPNAIPSDSDMDVWMLWFDSIKESIVDMGNPFTDGMLVTSGPAAKIAPKMNPISGYTVIKANDMDIELKGLSIEVTKTMQSDPRRISKIDERKTSGCGTW